MADTDHRLGRLVASVCLAALAARAGPVWAQGAAATAGTDSTGPAQQTLQEVVVTAERRNSTVQRTPASITAISGQELLDRGVTSATEALYQAPGVSMKSAGPGQTEIEMRGLGSAAGASPTVGFYLDDASLTPPVQTFVGKVVVDPDLYDLNRIEVLRGPQGTLYGSGSMGGTIRLITNQPDFSGFYGSVNMDASGTAGGNAPNGAVDLSLNVPLLTDKVALRIVATDKYNSGWIDRIVEDPFPLESNNGCAPTSFSGCARGNVLEGNVVDDHKDVNWEHLQGERATLLVRPNEKLNITTTFFYQDIKQGGANTYDVPPGTTKEAHYQPADVSEPFYDNFLLASNALSYDFDFANLNAATSYWNRSEQQTQDFSETLQNLFGFPNYLSDTDQGLTEKDVSRQISEEIRLTSKSNGPIKWIGGVYFSQENSSFHGSSVDPSYCDLSSGGCAANPAGALYLATYQYQVTQYAVFGEGTYNLTSALSATVGLRYFDFQNTGNFSVAGLFSANGNATPITAAYKSSSRGVTPKFNVGYEPSADLTVYGTAAEGFREGGVNTPIPTAGPASCLPSLQAIGYNGAPTAYSPDNVWSYELGEKAHLLGNRLTVNSDVYYIDWQKIQQSITPACGFNFTGNVGSAASYGPELELHYKITGKLSFDGSGAYTHATLTHVDPGLGFHSGEPILNIPRYTTNIGLVYDTYINPNLRMTARLMNSLVGPATDIAYTYVDLRSYDIANARLQFASGPLSYAVYINNLTNTRAQLSSNNTLITVSSPTYLRMSTNQPLTVGVDARRKF